jgi:molybdopterin converting factor small subunit
MKHDDCVIVEFYGIPRQRAGRAQLSVPAGTLGEVLQAVTRSCPGLDILTAAAQVSAYFRISLNGERFMQELADRVMPGARVLILSADAGG